MNLSKTTTYKQLEYLIQSIAPKRGKKETVKNRWSTTREIWVVRGATGEEVKLEVMVTNFKFLTVRYHYQEDGVRKFNEATAQVGCLSKKTAFEINEWLGYEVPDRPPCIHKKRQGSLTQPLRGLSHLIMKDEIQKLIAAINEQQKAEREALAKRVEEEGYEMYLTASDVIDMMNHVKEEEGLSQEEIAKEVEDLTGEPITRQSIASVLAGKSSPGRMLAWLEHRYPINPAPDVEIERGEDGKPVMYYRLKQKDA